MQEEKIQIMFLVETDTSLIKESKDHKIKSFNTVLPEMGEQKEKLSSLHFVVFDSFLLVFVYWSMFRKCQSMLTYIYLTGETLEFTLR